MIAIKTVVLSGIILLSGLTIAEAQDVKSVSGVVTAFKSIPLNNVSILSQKSGNKVLTDSEGQFTIICLKNDVLIVTASGFETRKAKVGKESTYKIDLDYEDNATNFNDAISNGHIAEDMLKKLILSKSKASGKDFSKYKSIWELIASEMYNVRVNGTSVVNTKRLSFDTSPQVLYVVDDKIVSDISWVLPDDVKKIEFIDDVGASFYGQQGANGVLKITLK